MEASRPAGSFGIPDHIKKQIEESRNAKPEQPKEEPKSMPPIEAPPVKKESPEDKAEAAADDTAIENELKKKEFWEKQLEIKIEPKDFRDYLFKGRVRKEKVYVTSCGDEDFRVSFQSLTPADALEIDEKMSEFRDKGKFTAAGLANREALLTLSYALLIADGRSLGENPDARYKNLLNFGAATIDKIVGCWKGFSYLLNFALEEKKLLKK